MSTGFRFSHFGMYVTDIARMEDFTPASWHSR